MANTVNERREKEETNLSEDERDKEFNEDVERAKKLQTDRLFILKCKYGPILGEAMYERELKDNAKKETEENANNT